MDTKKYGLSGIGSNVQLGKGGPRVKDNSGVLEAKNAADNAYAVLRAAAPVGDNDLVTKKYLETKSHVIVTDQLDGGAPSSPADGVVYIVTTAGGTYSLKELYRREAGAWVAVSLFDGLTISISSPLAGGTDSYTMGRWMYDLDTTSWILVGPVSDISKVHRSEVLNLAFGSGASENIGSQIPANAIVTKVVVNVTQAFDGTAPTLDIGDAGDTDRFMGNAEIDLKTVGVYISDVHYLYGALTQALATYAADASAAGQAAILLEYRLA